MEEDFARMDKEDLIDAGIDEGHERKKLESANKDYMRTKPNYDELRKYYENNHPHDEYEDFATKTSKKRLFGMCDEIGEVMCACC